MATQLFFNHLSQLKFAKCIDLLSHQKGRKKSDMVKFLQQLVTCEDEYYSAQFAPKKKDIQVIYSFLSSRVQSLSSGAPIEADLAMFVGGTGEEVHQKTKSGSGIMYIRYNDRDCLDDIILSRQLLEGCCDWLQLRCEMIEFYRLLSNIKRKPDYEKLSNILKKLMLKYFKETSDWHPFLKSIQKNAEYEVNIACELFKISHMICMLQYPQACVNFFHVKSLLSKWQHLHDSSPKATLRKAFSSLNLSPNELSLSQEPQTPGSSLPNITTNPFAQQNNGSINGKNAKKSGTKNALLKTNLCKWLRMFYSFCLAKYTLYFHNTLKANSPSPEQFFSCCQKNIVDYIQWISHFTNMTKPRALTILYDAQHFPNHKPEINTQKGYDLYAYLHENDEVVQGIRQWPCLFVHPPERKDSEDPIILHWPNLLYLISSNKEELETNPNPLAFVDQKAKITYFYVKIDQHVYMSVIYLLVVEPKSKSYKLTIELLYQLSIFLAQKKLFSFLCAT